MSMAWTYSRWIFAFFYVACYKKILLISVLDFWHMEKYQSIDLQNIFV